MNRRPAAVCLAGLALVAACTAHAPSRPGSAATTGAAPATSGDAVAAGSSVPGLRVELLGLGGQGGEVTARFRVTNGGSRSLRSRVFGDPSVTGLDRQLGRDLGGAFLFDSTERALYAPLRDADGKVRGDRVPAELAPGQTVQVAVTFQRPSSSVVDVGFPKTVPFLRRSVG